MKSFKQFLMENVDRLMNDLESDYDVKLYISHYPKSNSMHINKIIVPKNKRNRGIGTSVIKRITDHADANKMTTTLSLAKAGDFGEKNIKQTKLRKWYSKMGFRKNKDRSISADMIREPK